MFEVGGALLRWEGLWGFGDLVREFFDGAGVGLSEGRLKLGKDLLMGLRSGL